MSWSWGGQGSSKDQQPPLEHTIEESKFPEQEQPEFKSPYASLDSLPSNTNILPQLESDGARYYTYNPYEGLNTLLDTASSQEAYKIPEMTEFIFEEERSIKKRSWSENFTFYTGCGALGGAVLGGTIGLYKAYRLGQTQQLKESTRLLVNRYINNITSDGRTMGNGMGVMGMFFAASESYYYNQARKVDYVPETLCTVGAGFTAGALYRSAYGMRTSLVAGAMGAAGAAGLLGARYMWNR